MVASISPREVPTASKKQTCVLELVNVANGGNSETRNALPPSMPAIT